MSSHIDPKIVSLSLGQLETNCYIVYCPNTLEAVIIDPADEGDVISQKVLELNLKPLSILLTHGHFDHVLGCLEIMLNFNIQPIIHVDDIEIIKKAQKSAQYWLKIPVDPIPIPTIYMKDGDTFEFGNCQLRVIETPGHTPGSVAFFSTGPSPILFTGDTLFQAGIGRTDHTYSSPLGLRKSLEILYALPAQTLCYCGHGKTTTILVEKDK